MVLRARRVGARHSAHSLLNVGKNLNILRTMHNNDRMMQNNGKYFSEMENNANVSHPVFLECWYPRLNIFLALICNRQYCVWLFKHWKKISPEMSSCNF